MKKIKKYLKLIVEVLFLVVLLILFIPLSIFIVIMTGVICSLVLCVGIYKFLFEEVFKYDKQQTQRKQFRKKNS